MQWVDILLIKLELIFLRVSQGGLFFNFLSKYVKNLFTFSKIYATIDTDEQKGE